MNQTGEKIEGIKFVHPKRTGIGAIKDLAWWTVKFENFHPQR